MSSTYSVSLDVSWNGIALFVHRNLSTEKDESRCLHGMGC